MDSSNQKLAEAEQLERLVATTSNIQKTLEMLFGNSDVIESQENQVGSIQDRWQKEEEKNYLHFPQLRLKPRRIDERVVKMIKSMSEEMRRPLQVYAVAAGCRVQFSGSAGSDYEHYLLDYTINSYHGWRAKQGKVGEWIQVSCEEPKYWTDVIIQGRGDTDEWVTSFTVGYTLNGQIWENVEEGKQFKANNDRSSKVKIQFKDPIYSRVLRIYPQTWRSHISLRFDAIYIDLV